MAKRTSQSLLIVPVVLMYLPHCLSYYSYQPNLHVSPYVTSSGDQYRDMETVNAARAVGAFAKRMQVSNPKYRGYHGPKQTRYPPSFTSSKSISTFGLPREDDEIFDFTDSRFVRPPSENQIIHDGVLSDEYLQQNFHESFPQNGDYHTSSYPFTTALVPPFFSQRKFKEKNKYDYFGPSKIYDDYPVNTLHWFGAGKRSQKYNSSGIRQTFPLFSKTSKRNINYNGYSPSFKASRILDDDQPPLFRFPWESGSDVIDRNLVKSN